MTDHDLVKELLSNKQLVERLSQKFAELTADITEIMEKAHNPVVIAALLFKLAEERNKSNEILKQINQKFDEIMFRLKTGVIEEHETPYRPPAEILPEQDRMIMDYIAKNGKATAADIQIALNYKGLNGASQRLNKLCKENYLQKVRAGKRVLYLLKS